MKYFPFFLMLFFVLAGCDKAPDDEASQALEAPSQGQLAYESHCISCHSNGINGAPIPGKPKMWASRIVQGVPVLVDHAINGYGLMPAKGGKESMSDADVEAAVKYMIR